MKAFLITYGLVIGLLILISSSLNPNLNGSLSSNMNSVLTSYCERYISLPEITGVSGQDSDHLSIQNVGYFLYPEFFTYQEQSLALSSKNNRTRLGIYSNLKI